MTNLCLGSIQVQENILFVASCLTECLDLKGGEDGQHKYYIQVGKKIIGYKYI